MKLATLEKLHSVRPHTNADTLMCGKILGWPVVFRKDDFKEGDLGVFIFPDVLVDANNPAFAFLAKNHFKVWMAKFRGEPSAGLLMPLSLLADYVDADNHWVWNSLNEEGKDVGDLIKCVKFEKPLPKNLDARGQFPTHLVSITDEDNLLSNPAVFEELRAAGPLYVTLKCDGSSGTFISHEDEIHVCSRRMDLKLDGHNEWTAVVKKYNMADNAPRDHIAVQFEVVGPGLNGNKMGLKEPSLRVFNVIDTLTRESFGMIAVKAICNYMELPMVPVIVEDYHATTLDALVELANSVKYPNGRAGEGIVIRPMVPAHSELLNKSLSVKIINSNYKD